MLPRPSRRVRDASRAAAALGPTWEGGGLQAKDNQGDVSLAGLLSLGTSESLRSCPLPLIPHHHHRYHTTTAT